MSGSSVRTRGCWTRGALVIALAAAVVVCHARGAHADPGREAEEVRAAVVKIFTTHQVPLYLDPWSPGWVYSASGSGCAS